MAVVTHDPDLARKASDRCLEWRPARVPPATVGAA